ncbi:MAG: hypothetical protein K2Z25_16420 [Beijerinckiaceae bacterium]|nr:hypothetical protein [Beijerinckiaceae bacterium]
MGIANDIEYQMLNSARENTLGAAFGGFTIGFAMAQFAEDGASVIALWRGEDGYFADYVVKSETSKSNAAFLVSCREEVVLYQAGLDEIRKKMREAA